MGPTPKAMGFPWGFHGKFLMVSVKQLVHQQSINSCFVKSHLDMFLKKFLSNSPVMKNDEHGDLMFGKQIL
jgi:hypothetical protein